MPASVHLRDMPLTMKISAFNSTHFAFGVGPAASSKVGEVALVSGEVVSWGFTGALVGVWATSNGAESSTMAYLKDWYYEAGANIGV